MNKEKICLIGYGYWGKILHKNLTNLGYKQITIVDEVLDNIHEIDESFDYYFVVTPFTTHKKVLNQLSKYSNKKIWCEKPLAESVKDIDNIYKKLESKNNKLFVDWVYTHNTAIDFIKKSLKGKKVKQVVLNRTNDGPVRFDCNSIWDLSSHDISIIYKVFELDNFKVNWDEFTLKTNEKFGSNISWAYKDGMQVIINSSWQHQFKNRVSLFVTEKDEMIIFDDIAKTVTTGDGKVHDFSNDISPLEEALNFFFTSKDFKYNKNLTYKITKTITELGSRGDFIGGKAISKFEEEFAKYTGSKHAIGVSNGTDGLKIAFQLFDLNEEDCVILPSNTFIADYLAIKNCPIKQPHVVLVDNDVNFTINVNDLSKFLDNNRKKYRKVVVVPVHLYGYSCDMDTLEKLKNKHDLLILEDCSQSHGTLYKDKHVGYLGDVSVYSLYPGKNLGAMGDAGIITTNNEEFYKRCRSLRNYGSSVKYHYDELGNNHRMIIYIYSKINIII